MEKQIQQNNHEFYKQIKIFPPGCQTSYHQTSSSNDLYFVYSANMTVNIFYLKNFQLKCIFNPKIEKYVKSVCLNKGKSKELAVFYDTDVLIFDVEEEKVKETFKILNLKYMEFNSDNKLVLITRFEELLIYDMNKKKLDQLKGAEKVLLAKWYPFNNSELIYATKENKLCLRNINEKKPNIIQLDIDPKTLINELSWYNIDENYKYLLVGTNNGRAFLVDWSQTLILMKFEKFGSAILNMIWLKYEPGSFITITEKSNRVAFWNVSKKSYNDIAKFSECPILFCQGLNDPSRILMTLENGSIAIYDVEKRKTVFNLEPNHSETIFDLKYNPLLYWIFATCSYDSTIKVWDISQNKIICNIDIDFITKNKEKKINPELKTSVYSFTWSPIDKDLLISGDASNSLRLWDITKQKMISCIKLNSNIKESHIVGLDWDHKTNNIISTCSDAVYIINFANSKLEISKQILINSAIYQIKYNPFNNMEYAVACHDGKIRFFNVDADQPTKSLSGHSQKVFGIYFNKYIKGLMASTSEDFSVGIWDLENSKSFFLKGHKHNTRYAVWFPDIHKIIITGSWDGDIRIWNVDSATCITVITEHYSDVYGLDICPNHPYLLTSCSRDNSIRFWKLMGFSNKLIDSIINFTTDSFTDDIINKNMDLITKADFHDGLKDFWDLLRVATKVKEYSNENNKIFYITDLYSAYKSKAQKLEFTYYSKTKFNFSIKKEELLKEAIDLSAKAGDWEKFCELSTEINDWEKAIMAAPNVSISYWKKLTKRYADYCNNKNLPSKKFASLLSNQLVPAIKIFMDSGDYEDAKLIWLTRGNQPALPKENAYLDYENPEIFNLNTETINKINYKLSNFTREDDLSQIVYSIAKDHLQKGFPILAAGTFLSIKDTFNTFKILIRAAEYEIGYMLMIILNERVYEEEIVTSICMKELKKKNISNIASLLQNTDNISIKATIAFIVKNHMNTHDGSIFRDLKLDENSLLDSLIQVGNEFLVSICKNNINSAFNYYYHKTHDLASELKSRIVKIYNIEELMRLNFYFMAINSSQINEKILMRRLAVGAYLETLNKNFKSCMFYLSEISRLLKKNSKLDEDEIIFVSFASSFVNLEKTKFEEFSIDIHKTIYDLQNNFKDYIGIQSEFEREGSSEVLRYHCGDYGYFFNIREELLPVNINNQIVSSFNGNIIKGITISMKNSLNLSYSQALEWFKFNSVSPFLDELILFNPY